MVAADYEIVHAEATAMTKISYTNERLSRQPAPHGTTSAPGPVGDPADMAVR
jgi:hypothetical protein